MSTTPTVATSAVPANAAPVTVACPPCNCPSCPKCPDCGTPKVVVEEEKGSSGLSGLFSSPMFMYVAIAAALYFFLFHTQSGRLIAQQYLPPKLTAMIAPTASAPPYTF